MQNYTTEEIQKMLETAIAQRKRGYQLKVNRYFIAACNDQIRQFQAELAERVAA
jgi:hypothetical protein